MTRDHDDQKHQQALGRPSPKASLGNWRASTLPFSRKLQLAMRNNLIKLRRGQSCCGNHGEPGC